MKGTADLCRWPEAQVAFLLLLAPPCAPSPPKTSPPLLYPLLLPHLRLPLTPFPPRGPSLGAGPGPRTQVATAEELSCSLPGRRIEVLQKVGSELEAASATRAGRPVEQARGRVRAAAVADVL